MNIPLWGLIALLILLLVTGCDLFKTGHDSDPNILLKANEIRDKQVVKDSAVLLRDAFFKSEKEGWVLISGRPDPTENSQGSRYLARTEDGGKEWSVKPIPFRKSRSIRSDLYVLDDRTAVVCYSQIFRTTDGGSSWEVIREFTPFEAATELDFHSSGRGMAVGVNIAARTMDKGKSWEKLSPDSKGQLYMDVEVIDKNTVYVFSARNIYRTDDFGGSWTKMPYPVGDGQGVADAVFSSESHGWVMSTDSNIFETEDGGKTWNLQFSLESNRKSGEVSRNDWYRNASGGEVSYFQSHTRIKAAGAPNFSMLSRGQIVVSLWDNHRIMKINDGEGIWEPLFNDKPKWNDYLQGTLHYIRPGLIYVNDGDELYKVRF